MRSLDRNRVFDTKELEQLREDTYTVFEQAITVSEQYNQDRDEVMDLFDRVPAEARTSSFPLLLPTDFVYPLYADQQKKCNDTFESILCHIPQFDKEAADANEELISEIKETTRTVEELRELLKTGDVRLSVSAFEAKLKQICGPNFSEEEQAKMDLRLQTLGLVSTTVLTADPVNVVNGDFVLQENDLSIRGVPFLSFVRVYNSLNQENGIFGKGWSSSYEYRLKEKLNDTVTVLLPDGNRSLFQKRGERYAYVTGMKGQLIKNQLEWIYQREETTVTFGEDGRPRRIRNSYGKGILLFYTKEGALLQVMGEKNHSFTFHYEQDRLISMKDDSGRTVTYGYEGDSLSKVTDPMGGCECYSYNERDLLLKKQDRNGNQTVKNQYDEKGRVIRQQMWDGKEISYQYNEKKEYTEITYPDGHKTRYRYAPQSDTIEVTDEMNEPKWEPLCGTLSGLSPFEDMDLAIKQDREGKIIGLGKGKNQLTLIYEDQNGPSEIQTADGMTWRFVYDTNNRIIKRTDGRGYATCYTYDDCDRMAGITYPDGNKKEYQYDSEDQLIYLKKESGEEYRLSYDAGGHLTTITDMQGRSSSLFYDDCGKLHRIQTAEGSVYAYEWKEEAERETKSLSISVPAFQGTECYDAVGNVSKRIGTDGREEAYGYDCRNRLIFLQTADGGVYRFSYDQKGRCIKKTDPYGGETLFSYDEEGRVNAVTDPLGTFHAIRTQRFQVTEGEESKEAVPKEPDNPDKEPVTDYREEQISDFPPLTVTEERDTNKRLCKRKYPGGVESIYEYGKNGRIKSILHTDREGILEKREYTYDVMGNCTAIQKQSRNQAEAEETASYRYDQLGRLTQVSQNQSLIREYQYDALGNRTKKWEKGQEICYHNRKKEPPGTVTLVCKKGTEDQLLYEVTTKELHYEYRVSTLPVTLEIGGETKYLLTDHLGSILRILNQEGKTEKVYDYDEYGNSLIEEPQYVGYAGYPSTGNGTYAAGRRFYDPEQGRFLSRDLWFGNLGEPQTYNRYLYAVNNPIRYRDASGMSPTESALLKNPFEEETKEISFPTDMEKAVSETTSGIYKGRITEPIYQETGLDWLEKSVDWLMDTPYGDALSDSFFLMNPSFVASSYLKGMLIDGKSGEEVTQEFMEHSRGFHSSLIKTIPKQLYGIVNFPDTVKAELEEIAYISQCTNQTGLSRVFYTGNEYLNRKLDHIGNGIKGTINAYINGDARTKGEIEGKLLFAIAEIAATQPMVKKPMENKAMVTQPIVNKPVKLDGVDDKQIKQTIEERKQADIEELCLLLSYEKDLTGSEKIHRDTITDRIFEEGDIPKMRAVAEALSKKRICKWTQSERSFNEQVLRYGAEKEKTESNTNEGTSHSGLIDPKDLKPSAQSVEFISKYEGYREYAYADKDGKMTIGYGHVLLPGENYPDGITQEKAKELLLKEIKNRYCSASLDPFLEQYNIRLTQNQYDVLVSFTYNAGENKWNSKSSDFTLKALLINGNYTSEDIQNALLLYVNATDKNGIKHKLGGLWRRRMDEAEMFNLGDYDRDNRDIPKGYE